MIYYKNLITKNTLDLYIRKLSFYIPKQKKLFLLVGLLNVLLGNIILQVLLLKLSIVLSTLLGQTFSSIFGYITYGRFVFGQKTFNLKSLIYFFLLSILLWIINWIGISLYTYWGFLKFFAAILMVPKLALISYFYQKKIFSNKIYKSYNIH